MNAITLPKHDKLPLAFYRQANVCKVAKALIGTLLVSKLDGVITAGRIVETEAYNGVVDKASHAWNGRRTSRTEIMYAGGGVAYVYLCYGIHQLFNVVTNREDVPHAVLIRALEPVTGMAYMLQRTGKLKPDQSLTRGPGNVSRALGIDRSHTGLSLLNDALYIAEDGFAVKPSQLIATPRIGVGYAGNDADLPYRYLLAGNPYLSGKPSVNKKKNA